MDKQRLLNANSRAALINWLVAVQVNLKLDVKTLHISVKLTDLYLAYSGKVIQQSLLQLVGAASLRLACKYIVSGSE